MRIQVCLFGALVLFACGKEHKARSDASEPEAVSEAEFPERWLEARRAADERCCKQAGLTLHEPFDEAIGHVHARFDPASAATCLEEIRKAPCQLQKQAFPESSACDRVYEGTLALGERCTSPWDCALEEHGDGVNYCLATLGQPAGVCFRTHRRGEGESCSNVNQESLPCIWPLMCDDTSELCVRLPKLGEPCITGPVYGDTCGPGSVCDRMGTKRCVKPTPVGKPCTKLEECENLACVDGLCREPLAVVPICEAA